MILLLLSLVFILDKSNNFGLVSTTKYVYDNQTKYYRAIFYFINSLPFSKLNTSLDCLFLILFEF